MSGEVPGPRRGTIDRKWFQMGPAVEEIESSVPLSGRRNVRAIALAVLAVLILITSGFLIVSAELQPATARAPAAPTGGIAWVSPATLQSGQQLQTDPFTPLAGTPLSTLPNATVVGSVPPQKDTWFTVGFPLQNQTELAQIIAEQSTPGAPLYHHWLTQAQEVQMFGANRVEIQNTLNYFTSEGFTVGDVGPISISFHAPALSIESAFHTQLAEVAYHNSTTSNLTVANTMPLQLPQPIVGGVDAVDGLSGPGNYQVYHSINPQFATEVTRLEQAGLLQNAAAPTAPSTNYNATMEELFNYTDEAFTWFSLKYAYHTQALLDKFQSVSAPTFNSLFNANPLLAKGYNGNSTGTPITIAIVMGGGLNPGDLQSYSQLVYNNPNQIINRLTPDPVDGAYKMNGTLYYTDGASGEMALDVEFSSTMAPGAHIIPVYGPNLFGNYLDDVYENIWRMTTTPNIISNSWGGTEDLGGTLYSPGIGNDLTMNYYFQLIEARGSSILASSADGGGFDPSSGILSGAFPATDPYVLSVDGLRSVAQDSQGQTFPTTNLTYGISQAYIPILNLFQPGLGVNVNMYITHAQALHNQSYWYEPIYNFTLYTAPPSGSGGFGFSYWFQQPYWEHGPNIPNIGRSLGSGVAAEADYNMSIFFDGIPNFLYGGTSFACPTTAGMLADIEDYLKANGHSSYLGNVNQAVYDVGNAWLNGNLSLAPYYDVTNGTSYWGNHGAELQYAWPPGQNFPVNGNSSTYGNTMPGWDFPTGWGSINVYNFALDLNQLMNEESFMTVNPTTSTFAPVEWQDLTLNQTYAIEVNATTTIAASNPVVSVEYFPQGGTEQTWTYSGSSLVQSVTPAVGLRFILNTGIAPFTTHFSPGTLIFTLGDSSNKNLGFAYDWVGPQLSGGKLTVQVVNPSPSGSINGGCATANLDSPLGDFSFEYFQSGLSCFTLSTLGSGYLYENTFAVRVTNSAGKGVYNAVVDATIGNYHDLAYVGSQAEAFSSYLGQSVAPPTQTEDIVSQTFTNVTGYALVQTWNMERNTPYFVNATYGNETGGTTYMVDAAPNISPGGINSGTFAEFNPIDVQLWLRHSSYSNATLDGFLPNYTNQTSLYDSLYAWQGQVIQFRVTNSTGAPEGGQEVWLGTPDTGREYKFQRYSPSGGVRGMTNVSGTVGYTDPGGYVTLNVPDNASDGNFWGNIIPAPMGLADVAVTTPGVKNQTFSYGEICAPDNRSNPSPTITCQFNNSYARNYTAAPLWILPNPVNITTMTPQHLARSFFPTGSPVAFRVNVSLPTQDPLLDWYYFPSGYNQNPGQWSSGLEHITGMTAYVDGHEDLNITPEEPPQIQNYAAYANLTGTYSNGTHYVTVYVTTSMGQTFSFTKRFVVGSVINENLNPNSLYTVLPYQLNWSVNIPSHEINNASFNSSLQISYLSPCGKTPTCPVVNYSIRVTPGRVNYNQSINTTLLGMNGFGFGTHSFPSQSPYEVTIWFNANHSGSFHVGISTQFVFNPLQGNVVGPGPNATVPLGNVTIAYTYQGAYISGATLEVWQDTQNGIALPNPLLVYNQLAFIPSLGGESRSGSATWTAVATGTFYIELSLSAPYANYTSGVHVNVLNQYPTTLINKTSGAKPLFNVNPAALSTILTLVGAIIGLLLGLWIAPAIRPSTGPSGAGSPKAWDEGRPGAATAGGSAAAAVQRNECSICHERFETALGLTQHLRVVHGIED